MPPPLEPSLRRRQRCRGPGVRNLFGVQAKLNPPPTAAASPCSIALSEADGLFAVGAGGSLIRVIGFIVHNGRCHERQRRC